MDEKNIKELEKLQEKCAHCGEAHSMFVGCAPKMLEYDKKRAEKLGDRIGIAVVRTAEGNLELVRTVSLAELREKSYYMERVPKDARPALGYQRPESDLAFDSEVYDAVTVDFFAVSDEGIERI